MSEPSSDLWNQTLGVLKQELSTRSFDIWIQPVRPVKLDASALTLEVPNPFFKEWIVEHYLSLIQSALARSSGRVLDLEVVVQKQPQAVPQTPEQSGQLVERFRTPQEASLNPKYTFESFVVGPANRFAHAAAFAVAESPAKTYNPLFFYGGVGLGKTHLMQAIGHHVVKRQSQLRIVYISSEKFTNQLILSIQNRTTSRFRERYRNVDVLLIDDIQFIGGKESTQEEFFHTFNTLHDAHKQIVISCDRRPKEIPGLENRLVSRFEWGLVADIQPPDLETRVAILHKRLEREPAAVPVEVTQFIAENFRVNIRELEGALVRVIAYASLMGTPMTLEVAKEVLKDSLREGSRVTVERIQRAVAEYFDMEPSEMKTKRRSRSLTYPRQVAMYLSRELTAHSLPEIGEFFGGRDHTTVLHACAKLQQEARRTTTTKALLDRLIQELKR